MPTQPGWAACQDSLKQLLAFERSAVIPTLLHAHGLLTAWRIAPNAHWTRCVNSAGGSRDAADHLPVHVSAYRSMPRCKINWQGAIRGNNSSGALGWLVLPSSWQPEASAQVSTLLSAMRVVTWLFWVPASLADHRAIAKPSGKAFVAGEATEPKYPGTVHGALRSGIRAAEQVKKALA